MPRYGCRKRIGWIVQAQQIDRTLEGSGVAFTIYFKQHRRTISAPLERNIQFEATHDSDKVSPCVATALTSWKQTRLLALSSTWSMDGPASNRLHAEASGLSEVLFRITLDRDTATEVHTFVTPLHPFSSRMSKNEIEGGKNSFCKHASEGYGRKKTKRLSPRLFILI